MKLEKETSNTYNSIVKELAIASMLLALMGATAAFFAYAIPPFAAGYSIDPEIIFMIIGFCILEKKSRSYFLFLSPFFLLLDFKFYFLSPLQFLLEYFLAIWCFGACFFYKEIIKHFKDKKTLLYFILATLFILAWILKLIFHLCAGYYFWDATWLGSFILNGQFVLINGVINLFIFFSLSPFLLKISLKSSYFIN